MGVILAVLVGLLDGIGGTGYKVAERGHVSAKQTIAFLSLAGMLFFGIMGWRNGEWQAVGPELLLLGVSAGVLQYIGSAMFDKAIKLGPMSLVWCAVAMDFLLPVVFAYCCYDENVSPWQMLALVIGLTVLVLTSTSASTEDKHGKKVRWWLFGLVLLGMSIGFGSLSCFMKIGWYYHVPGAEESLLQSGRNLFMCFTYISMLVCMATDVSCHRAWTFTRQGWLGAGMTILGVVGCYTLKLYILDLPAVLLFALPAQTSMLMVAVISTVFFHDRRDFRWYLTCGLSLVAIVLMAL